MKLISAGNDDNGTLLRIYNDIAKEDGIYYKPLDSNSFKNIFLVPGRAVTAVYNGEMPIGFAAGTALPGRDTAYLTYIGVLPGYRRAGVASELLHNIEAMLVDRAEICKIEIVFHNPAVLPWLIPGGDGDDHPCAPGADVSSDAYLFLKNHGYRDWCMQNSYYLRLRNYKEPTDIAEKRRMLAQSGIEITLYDPSKHHGLSELFDDINNPGWREQVMSNTDKPIIVAVDKKQSGLICGYTGPLTVQKSGRGNFCGIGTLHSYRGRGIGKVIFCEMCRRHSLSGAAFMSLYTGETNPARNIYEAAGFKIVRSWANMRKVIR